MRVLAMSWWARLATGSQFATRGRMHLRTQRRSGPPRLSSSRGWTEGEDWERSGLLMLQAVGSLLTMATTPTERAGCANPFTHEHTLRRIAEGASVRQPPPALHSTSSK